MTLVALERPQASYGTAVCAVCHGGGKHEPRRLNPRILIAIVIAVLSLISYYGTPVMNPLTNEVQHISMTVPQEIALGLQVILNRHKGGLPTALKQELV